MATLFLLTGAWGSGKSTLVPHLAAMLPEVVVFDWDALLPGLSKASGKDAYNDPSTWDGLWGMWAAIVSSVLRGGRDVLLLGPVRTGDIAGVEIPAENIRWAFLDCPDELLVERLQKRGEAVDEIADELTLMAELRQSNGVRVPVGERSTPEVAGDVAAWVRAGGAGTGQ